VVNYEIKATRTLSLEGNRVALHFFKKKLGWNYKVAGCEVILPHLRNKFDQDADWWVWTMLNRHDLEKKISKDLMPELIKSEGIGKVRLKESDGNIRFNCWAAWVVQTLVNGRWENAIALNGQFMPIGPEGLWGEYIRNTPALINVQGIGEIQILYIPSYSAFYK
jgi:hypothetical protein